MEGQGCKKSSFTDGFQAKPSWHNTTQLADCIAKITLIFDKAEADRLKGEKLKDHMRAFKNAGAPNLQNVKAKTLVADIRNAIKEAIDLFNEGKWTPSAEYAAQGEDSGEEFDFSEPNSSDEGTCNWETEWEVTLADN